MQVVELEEIQDQIQFLVNNYFNWWWLWRRSSGTKYNMVYSGGSGGGSGGDGMLVQQCSRIRKYTSCVKSSTRK
jgi:hypothetical protein